MNSKAQGLPLSTIVIAALVVIVLVVLVLLFSGNLGGFSRSMDDCETRGGQCECAVACEGASMAMECTAAERINAPAGQAVIGCGPNPTVCCVRIK